MVYIKKSFEYILKHRKQKSNSFFTSPQITVHRSVFLECLLLQHTDFVLQCKDFTFIQVVLLLHSTLFLSFRKIPLFQFQTDNFMSSGLSWSREEKSYSVTKYLSRWDVSFEFSFKIPCLLKTALEQDAPNWSWGIFS